MKSVLVSLAVVLAVTGCSGSSSTDSAAASATSTGTEPTTIEHMTTEQQASTSAAPRPQSDDPGVPFAEHSEAALLFSTADPSPDSAIAHAVVADPSAFDIVRPEIPYAIWAPLLRLDDAGTRLYAGMGYSLRGCDLPVPVEVDVTDDTVSITIATGADRRIQDSCDEGGSAGYLLPITIPGGIGERTIVQTGCVEHSSCSDSPNTLDELPLVRSQLVGCVPELLTSYATPAIFSLDVCDALTLAEDYDGLVRYP